MLLDQGFTITARTLDQEPQKSINLESMMLRILAAFLLVLTAPVCYGQPNPSDRAIEFPDVPGYQTLVTDLHLHTVFSDGSVWPDIRVQEAMRDGLDVIAVTDHLEYQPHRHDIPNPDRNRSHEIAVNAGEGGDLIIIRGSEITRSMPPGHANAIFLEDVNPLVVDDPVAAFRAAQAQDAFIFWNHPMWEAQAPTGIATLTDLHRQLLEEDLLHGIEVVNDVTYSDEALQIALDHDLTILGTSDIHGLVDWQFDVPHGGHRPVTLVFAEERSEAAVRDALFAGRTVVWFEELLVGREEHLVPLLEASVEVASAEYEGDTAILRTELTNRSDVRLLLRNRSDYGFHGNAEVIDLPPNKTTTIRIKTVERLTRVDLPFEVMNAVVAPRTHPTISLTLTPR